MNLRYILVERPIEFLRTQRILRDRFLRWFLIIALLLCFVEVGMLLFRLRPTGFVVPLEYVSGAGLTRLGDWQLIYGYGVFSLFVTFGNIALAIMSFEKSRITSFFLLLAAIVINIFTLVITNTLLAQLG